MITILSVPRTGTRFFGNFVLNVLGLHVEYAHFSSKNKDAIEHFLNTTNDIIIVPMRGIEATRNSIGEDRREFIDDAFIVRDHFAPRLRAHGAHFIDTVKNNSTPDQVRCFLTDVNARWTSDVSEFVSAWRPIGSQYICDDKSKEITRQMINFRALANPQRN